MKNLLLSKCQMLGNSTQPDVVQWFELYKLINLNVSLVDRCNYINIPYRFENKFPMPTLPGTFNKNYTDICIERARNLIAHSKNINKPITVLWSGGIDSTVVLISFILGCPDDLDRISVALNPYSILENPNFYYKHIRNRFNMLPSERTLDLLNGSCIMVGGEFNDQLFGSDILRDVKEFDSMDLVHAKNTHGNIVPFLLSKGMSEDAASKWYSLLNEHIRNVCPVEVDTVHLFFWWLNFAFKWQSVYYRIPERIQNRKLLTDEFLSQHYMQFFEATDFQIWSMLNPSKKISNTWESYKLEAKKMIFDFNKDQDYFDNKVKKGSLSQVFKQRKVPDALAFEDGNYIFVDELNPAEFYNPNNHFKL